MLNPGECLLLCSTVVMMTSGNIGPHIPRDVIPGQSAYFHLPIQAKSHSVIWSFRKIPFIDLPCDEASRNEREIQWQWEVFPDGSLNLINVTCCHQGRYVASMTGKDSSATVIYDLYVWPSSDNKSVKKRTDEKMFTLRSSEVVGIVLGILCVLVIAVIIFLILKTKGKVQVTEYENANMSPPHTYVNTSAPAQIRVPRTDSADPDGHYQRGCPRCPNVSEEDMEPKFRRLLGKPGQEESGKCAGGGSVEQGAEHQPPSGDHRQSQHPMYQ